MKAKLCLLIKKLTFGIDTDYLCSIFPDDGKCPVFGIELVWGGKRTNSPSLDQINPNGGYVEGNVRWLSDRANRVRNNANLEDLKKVASWLRKAISEKEKKSNENH